LRRIGKLRDGRDLARIRVAGGAERDDVYEAEVICPEGDDHQVGLGGIVVLIEIGHPQPVAELRRTKLHARRAPIEGNAVVVGRARTCELRQFRTDVRSEYVAIRLCRIVA
jgi:hypothetical protein